MTAFNQMFLTGVLQELQRHDLTASTGDGFNYEGHLMK